MNGSALRRATVLIGCCFAAARPLEDDMNHQLSRLSLAGIVGANVMGTIALKRWPAQTLKACAKPNALFLPTLVHADIKHLAPNILVLGVIWDTVCSQVGAARTSSLYVGSAVVTSLVSRSLSPINSLTIGSSGAVSAVLSVFLMSNNVGPIVAPFGAAGLVATSLMLLVRAKPTNVDHLAHLIGTSIGICCNEIVRLS